jgi:nitrogen fixation protein NifU and related proteins
VSDAGPAAPAAHSAGARGPASLDALYQEQILDHYRRPHGKGALATPDATATARNPLCGEELTVSVQLDHQAADVRVADVRFAGQGCSISTASASMMTDLARGRSAAELTALTARLTALLQGDRDAARDETLGPLRAFTGVARVPVRIPCALLAWEALRQALNAAR